MESCTRRLHFCYGHRLVNHESKCATLHGHNGYVEISATPTKSLDALGRVIDFSVLKEKIGGWIDENWDHTTILCAEDSVTIKALQNIPRKKDLFILPYNPTAENLAKYLLWEVCPKLLKGSGVIVYKVIFRETDNCSAEQSCEPADPKICELYGIR